MGKVVRILCAVVLAAAVVAALSTPLGLWRSRGGLSHEALAASADAQARALAARVLKATGVKGGLIVHIGCGEGRLTAALRANESYLVHGLDTSADNVKRAREYIRSRGLYGPVCVDRLTSRRLPYIDNLVNLVVSEDLGQVSMSEVMRVLAPNGVAYIKRGMRWEKTVKPRPKEIDEWTHFFHDATGNAVANDLVVGPPRHMQWVGSPRWARHHDHMASLSALVSANGRIFYIFDEGPTQSIQLPPKWMLIARDAFNGTILWKRPIPRWYPHLWPLKSGPAQLTRRLVAVGDTVFVPLGIDAPVSALDAATGKVLRTYPGTAAGEELLWSEGVLVVVANPNWKPVLYKEESVHCWTERDRASKTWGWDEKDRWLVAFEARTGRELWRIKKPVVPLALAADNERVFFHDGERVVCVGLRDGKVRWQSEPIPRVELVPTGYSPHMVVYKDVVLFSGKKGSLFALSADTGKTLWSSKLPSSGHFCPEDIFVLDGLIWAGEIASARQSGVFSAIDVRTGEVKVQFPPDIKTFFMHQRCYPSKATVRYLIPSRTGTEFIDPKKHHWILHHWVRGGCIYGVMPCNGLLYTPPHSCACYYQSKLCGFCALAPERPGARVPKEIPDEERLERGPAYGQLPQATPAGPEEWPTYRHDMERSGRTDVSLSTDLREKWARELGGKLSAVVVALGKVFVAKVDEHTLYALDAQSGDVLWTYTAGGRIDSPPTIYQGLVLFGSADGWVYCLRASDGELVWRFRVAPLDRRLVANEQVESVWPVHGSVLVQNGVLYCVAGRSMFLDGGLRLVRLDPKTGKKLSETVMDDIDPETGQNLQVKIKIKKMPVALPDILSSDGKFVYMRSQRFDLQGKRVKIEPEPETDQLGEGIHLFCPTSFLDDTWFHRTYWIYGKNAGEGWAEWSVPAKYVPAGRILTFDDTTVYGYARDLPFYCNSSVLEYRLFAANKVVREERINQVNKVRIPQGVVHWKNRARHKPEELTAVDYRWEVSHPPLHVRAIALAGGTLVAGGPPDVVDEYSIFGRFLEPDARKKLEDQVAAWEGKMGGVLWLVSAKDGKKLAELKLESVPRFDGFAVAYGRLYMSTDDGKLVCLGAG